MIVKEVEADGSTDLVCVCRNCDCYTGKGSFLLLKAMEK